MMRKKYWEKSFYKTKTIKSSEHFCSFRKISHYSVTRKNFPKQTSFAIFFRNRFSDFYSTKEMGSDFSSSLETLTLSLTSVVK